MKIFVKNNSRLIGAKKKREIQTTIPSNINPNVQNESVLSNENANNSSKSSFIVQNGVIKALSPINMHNQKIVSLQNPTEAGDAVNLIYLQSFLNSFLKNGDAQNIVLKRLGNPVDKSDACTKEYVDKSVALVGKQQDKTIKMIFIPSQANGIFSSGPVLKDVKLLHVVVNAASQITERSRLTLILKDEKLDRRELTFRAGGEFEINYICRVYTSVSFEMTPTLTGSSITLYYIDQPLNNKIN